MCGKGRWHLLSFNKHKCPTRLIKISHISQNYFYVCNISCHVWSFLCNRMVEWDPCELSEVPDKKWKCNRTRLQVVHKKLADTSLYILPERRLHTNTSSIITLSYSNRNTIIWKLKWNLYRYWAFHYAIRNVYQWVFSMNESLMF